MKVGNLVCVKWCSVPHYTCKVLRVLGDDVELLHYEGWRDKLVRYTFWCKSYEVHQHGV